MSRRRGASLPEWLTGVLPAGLHDRLTATLETWHAGRQRRRTARAAHLDEDEAYDLMFLTAEGFVRAKATGQTITRITASIENRLDRTLRVLVRPGTYFVARGQHQNMVTCRERIVRLAPDSVTDVVIDAACINAGRPIPGTESRFAGVRRVGDNVARFLEASAGADPMVVQAGVWALTDHLSAAAIRSRLVLRDHRGATRAAISEAHIAEARRILDELEIPHPL